MSFNIQPISGFPEFMPGEQITFNRVVDVIRKGFERAGAVPIETPAVERVETLSTAKGNISKEVYGLRILKAEEGDDGKDLALHFDLTVPLARYVAQHSNDLAFPFRRYQIQPVWRGERAQSGRYRQFYQCDIDVIGEGELSLLNDAEMPFVIYQIFKELNIGHFYIRINNRKILQGFLLNSGVSQEEIQNVIGIVDAIDKVGVSQVREQLGKAGLTDKAINSILEFFSMKASSDELINYLISLNIEGEFATGVDELTTVMKGIDMLGVPSDYYGSVFVIYLSFKTMEILEWEWQLMSKDSKVIDEAVHQIHQVFLNGMGLTKGWSPERIKATLSESTLLGLLFNKRHILCGYAFYIVPNTPMWDDTYFLWEGSFCLVKEVQGHVGSSPLDVLQQAANNFPAKTFRWIGCKTQNPV